MRHVFSVRHAERTGPRILAIDRQPSPDHIGGVVGSQVGEEVIGAVVIEHYELAVGVVGIVGQISREGLFNVLRAAFARGTENDHGLGHSLDYPRPGPARAMVQRNVWRSNR